MLEVFTVVNMFVDFRLKCYCLFVNSGVKASFCFPNVRLGAPRAGKFVDYIALKLFRDPIFVRHKTVGIESVPVCDYFARPF